MMASSVLVLLQLELIRYGMSTVFILGVIGNFFVIILFRRRRQNSCAIYLSGSALLNTLGLAILIPVSVYRTNNQDPTSYSLLLCKSRYYFSNTWGQVARYLITLACIDRFVLTTSNPRFQAMHRPKVARKIMCIAIVFYHVFLIHLAILTTIQNGQCGQFGVYYLLYQIHVLIFLSLIPLVLMSVFGYWTYRNVRQLYARIRPAETAVNQQAITAVPRRDRDLLTMVLTEVLVYAATMFWYPFILLEIALTTYLDVRKSTERIQIEGLLYTIATLFLYINSAIAFYLYLIVSKPFRKDLKELITRWGHRITRRG
jgi:hypothetical protein